MSRKQIGLAIILVAAVALVVTGLLHLRHGRIFPSTDNAYVQGDVTAVASRIPGMLLAVEVEENERIAAGQVIAELDPRDYEQAVAEAEAALHEARADLALDQAKIAGAEAQVAVARSQVALAHADRDRYTELHGKGSVADRQYDQAVTAAEVAEAQLTAAEKGLAAARAKLAVDETNVVKMQARYDQALLRRSYCTITAPCAGIVADKSAQPGQIVSPGQPLCRLAQIEAGHVWIDANFKETQIRRIRPGQPATIRIDVDKQRELRGTVSALSAGTGAAFSLLPPQNASGNWVKIVQRVPVRIDLELDPGAEQQLRLGLSAHVTVDTRSWNDR
jgi:membrane fusion protein (multidrug efflux system)